MDEEGVRNLLNERPKLEEPLREILQVDEREDSWEFDDIPTDTGTFGQLVSEGVVEKTGRRYRLADPEGVRTALEADRVADGAGESGSADLDLDLDLDLSTEAVASLFRRFDSAGTVVLAGIGVFLIVLVRVTHLDRVLIDGQYVLAGNDPYFYRFWVESLLTGNDVGLSSLPGEVADGEPLMIASLAAIAGVLGGGPSAINATLAWYPVASAILTALVLFYFALRLTGDRLAALAAVVVLAYHPLHASRTMIGFADHHAFDYLWLILAAVLLHRVVTGVEPADIDPRESTVQYSALALVAGFGLAVAGQILSWDAGLLLTGPVGLAAVALAARSVWADEIPSAGVPVLVGLSVTTLVVASFHVLFGWQDFLVVAALLILLVGVGVALGAGEAIRRWTGRLTHLLVAYVLLFLAAAVVLGLGAPDLLDTFVSNVAGRLLGSEGYVVEARNLLNRGVITTLGLTFVPALPAMLWQSYRIGGNSNWLVPTTYAWFLFALTVIQARFGGEFAPFVSLFAGYGLVWIARRAVRELDERDAIPSLDPRRLLSTSSSVPDLRAIVLVAVLLVPVAAVGAGPASSISQALVNGGDTYSTGAYLAGNVSDAEQDGDTYVLSHWGRNRLYNHYAGGEYSSYGYARQTYPLFRLNVAPDRVYDRISDRVDYVVLRHALLRPGSGGTEQNNAGLQLLESLVIGTNETSDVAHFRILYTAPNGSISVWEPVEGAVLTGTVAPNSTVAVRTGLDIPNIGTEGVSHLRRTTSGPNGTFSIRVPYPGRYVVATPNVNRTVVVPESAVQNGSRVRVDLE